MTSPPRITRGINREYIARVRAPGCRKYLVVLTTKCKVRAIRAMAAWMAKGNYKRGDVLFVSDWYEPVQVIEMVRR